MPFFQNFSSEDYRESQQNWCVIEDSSGILYFGNSNGLLIYDGAFWKFLDGFSGRTVRSLCNVGGRIYWGAIGDFGYLKLHESGELQAISLRDKLPEAYRNFKDIWTIRAIDDTVFFHSRNNIYRWRNQQLQVLKSTGLIYPIFAIEKTIYTTIPKAGLCKVVGDTLLPAPGGKLFANAYIDAFLPYDENRYLIGTRRQGLFLYDGITTTPFNGAVNTVLQKNLIRSMVKLSDNLYAAATLFDGLTIFDARGDQYRQFNKTSGLLDNRIFALFADRQDGLWLAMNNGLSRIELLSPLSNFTEAMGLKGPTLGLRRHRGTLYAVTPEGIFYLEENNDGYPAFKPVIIDGRAQGWAVENTADHLLIGTERGVFEITGNKAIHLESEGINNIRVMKHSSNHPTLMFVGMVKGLAAYQLQNNTWRLLGALPGVDETIEGIAEAQDGTLWLGTSFEGLIKIEGISSEAFLPFSAKDTEKPLKTAVIKRYGLQNNLPGQRCVPAVINGHLVFATQEGLKRFDISLQKFLPETRFGSILAETACAIYNIIPDNRGNAWFIAQRNRERIDGYSELQDDGSYLWKNTPFLRIKNVGEIYSIYPENNGTVWFGGAKGIVKYSASDQINYQQDYRCLIRLVSVRGDSVIFGDLQPKGLAIDQSNAEATVRPFTSPLQLPYSLHNIRFEFSAPSYTDVSANRFQIKLDGFDDQWTDWRSETHKEYTGLSPGHYQFNVRAMNIYQHQSSIGTFEFTVLPPWYRAWWAYLIYFLLFSGLIVGLVKFRVRQLEAQTRVLEAQVLERTATVRRQAEKLKEMDHLKSQFFANISHEFRTPLTLILGPLQDVIGKLKQNGIKKELTTVQQNAGKLLGLINQLLDISRLETGRMQLHAESGNFIPFLRGLVTAFSSLADQKNIKFSFKCDKELQDQLHREMYYDKDKIEKIMNNLLSNAFKFTPKGGTISVTVESAEPGAAETEKLRQEKNEKREESSTDNRQSPSSKYVSICLKDSGIGIPEDRLPHIFDRFYQVDSSHTREHEGSGIGLALTRELVERHYGVIEVKSEENHGSIFRVLLPLGYAHFQADELEQSMAAPEPAIVKAAPMTMMSETAEEAETPAPADSSTIVLVVDDHPDIRRFIRNRLQPAYRVLEAKNGKDGLEKAQEHIPDLIISDVMMPLMDGYQLCEAIKTHQTTNHIPVVLLTAKAGEDSKLAGLETGADDYLTKPFSSDELRVRVRNLIDSRHKLREHYRAEGLLEPGPVKVTSMEAAFLKRLREILDQHLTEEDFSLEDLYTALGMSERQLQRKIRAITGQTPSELIRDARLERAKLLLQEHSGNVAEICYEVGFSNPSYFAKCFKDRYGMSPTQFSKKQ